MSRFQWFGDAVASGLQQGMRGGQVNMPHDKVIRAYTSYVTIMDMIADQGDNVSEVLVIEALDDILQAWLEAHECRDMIRYIIVGARSGEIDADAAMDVEKTRAYLAENG